MLIVGKLIFFVALLLIGENVKGQDFLSPCPKLFKYVAVNETDRWYGQVILTTDVELHDGIWLILVFDKPSIEIQSEFGQKNYKLKETEYLLRTLGIRLMPEHPLTVKFAIKYDPNDGIPMFEGFRINTRPSCPEPKRSSSSDLPITSTTMETLITTRVPLITSPTTSEGQFVTSEELPVSEEPDDSSVSNNIINSFINNGDMEFIFNSHINASYYPGDIAFSPNAGQPTLLYNFNENQNVPCGTVVKNPKMGTSAQYPWHVILFNFIGPQIMYSCGGSLISDRHVLTAAHCVTRPRSKTPINLDILSVFLGKQNLKSFGPHVQVKEVSAIFVHPAYNFNVLYNDLAIITLATQVMFTDFVRPVCLWDNGIQRNLGNEAGVAVGYGFDMKKQVSTVLRGVPMPIISKQECLRKGPLFPKLLFDNNFCAGFENGTMNCNGDSGGGMVFLKPDSTHFGPVWQIRGLISIGVALQGQYVCNEMKYVIFTDVTKYLDWIKSIVKRN